MASTMQQPYEEIRGRLAVFIQNEETIEIHMSARLNMFGKLTQEPTYHYYELSKRWDGYRDFYFFDLEEVEHIEWDNIAKVWIVFLKTLRLPQR